MTFQKIIENNLNKVLTSENSSNSFFVPTSKEQLSELTELLGNTASRFIEFYQDNQPDILPILKSKTRLLDIESIIEENMDLAPGAYLSKLGIYVFAVTIGGNVICIDVNDMKEGDPVVLIIDHTFCYCDEDEEEIEIVNLPSYIDESEVSDEDFEFNYKNIRKFVYKIEDSFVEFMKKFSLDEYDDLELLL